jgi:hypothetical protein
MAPRKTGRELLELGVDRPPALQPLEVEPRVRPRRRRPSPSLNAIGELTGSCNLARGEIRMLGDELEVVPFAVEVRGGGRGVMVTRWRV